MRTETSTRKTKESDEIGQIPLDSSRSSQTGDSTAGSEQQNLLLLFCLVSFLGHLSSVPLTLSLEHATSASGTGGFDEDWTAVVSDLLLSSVFTILVMLLGFRAGRRVQLGYPILAGFGQSPIDRAKAKRAMALAVAMGLISACNAVLLDITAGAMLPQATIPITSLWQLSLASVGASINEEILCRLGFMTFLVWLLTTITHRREPVAAFMWFGIVLSALGFASLHLPQAIRFHGHPTMPLFVLVFGGNGIPGFLFGWLFWKKGIVAAMIAHFTADILIYGLLPALCSSNL